MSKPQKLIGHGWETDRCRRLPEAYRLDAQDGGRGIPVQARDYFRLAFEGLTEPTTKDSPIDWALCDCQVNGVPSMAIVAVMGGVARPVFVVPVAGMLLRNWCGDPMVIREHSILQHPWSPESAESAARRMLTNAPGVCPPGLRNRPRG